MIVKGAGESLRKKMTDAARAKVRLVRHESCFTTEFPAAKGREGYRVTGSMLCRILRRSACRSHRTKEKGGFGRLLVSRSCLNQLTSSSVFWSTSKLE